MLKIEHLKKHYNNFSLDCSLEVKSLTAEALLFSERTYKALLQRIKRTWALFFLTLDSADI